jgi:hypothetical protein
MIKELMVETIKLFLAAFRQGSEVANAAAWKNGQITVTLLGGFMVTVLHLGDRYGVSLPIDTAQVNAIAAGVIALVNVVLTVATSEKVGLPASGDGGKPAGGEPGGDGKPAQDIDAGRPLG